MPVWDELVGQEPTVAVLAAAVADDAAMTHAWLLTGPPGSGRSTAAIAFAAALECERGGCGACHSCRTVLDGTHADVTRVATEGLSIGVDRARELALLAQHAPSVGGYRVIVVEDADRLTEQAANALLKAVEEPAPRTVWLLCAPSPEDVIITIRSRARHVRLRTPAPEAVAALLVRRDGIDPAMAGFAAHAAQSHIGIARRLARDEGARRRRHEIMQVPGQLRGLGDALGAAADLVSIAEEEAASAAAERGAREKARLLEQLGADPGARTQPPHVRTALAQLEKEQKARQTRHTRDVIDRALVDLTTMYRDALMHGTGSSSRYVNMGDAAAVADLSRRIGPEGALAAMESIGQARAAVSANAAPLLALEAMMIALLPGR